MTIEMTPDLPEFDEPEMFPRIQIYLTGTLDVGRGWAVAVAVQTADGKNVLQRWSRAGGSLSHGEAKMIADLTTAYEIALSNLQVFG